MRATATLLTLMSFAVVTQATAQDGTEDRDPYEGFNRSMFEFNENVDKAVLQPISKAYTTVTPRFARDRVGDFLSNLREPVVFANDVLQAEPGRAVDSATRFAVNTTIGVVGLWDAAEYFGIEKHQEDFGQTLGRWGVDSGPYLVLPLLGPTTPRDLTGTVVDRAINPITWAEFEGDDAFRATRITLGALNGRSGAQPAIDQLRSQPEPYTALRRIYLSGREAAIRNGQEDPETPQNPPDFLDYE